MRERFKHRQIRVRDAQLWCSGAFAFRNRCSSARVDPHTAPSRAQREQAMPQIERERVIETEGTLPDGREVKRVVDTARVTETATEARAGTTGQGVSTVLVVSVSACIIAMIAVWYFFFT